MLPCLVSFLYLCISMRIVKTGTLQDYCRESRYRNARKALQAWIFEVKYSKWNNSAELKLKYKNASIISSKRVVFNIKGNEYRLIVDIEYKMKIVFIVWFGTHKEYEKIDAKEVSYES
ncbi:MAG: type II toxin-antitoxin system HigB family toxin [Bacteroidales bacterium]|nr:type II toxin-antitoxin system HigB family toxin [Bacteroidales bacterium]